MGRLFDQSGLDRTQAEFDEELRAMSWQVEKNFTEVNDTDYFSDGEVEDLADKFHKPEKPANHQIDGQMDLFGMEFDDSWFKPETSLAQRTVARLRKFGNAILVNINRPARF